MNFMLKLKNIRRTSEFIEADYFPESENERGYIKLDINSLTVIESKKTSFDDVVATYLTHARQALKILSKNATLPDEKTVMWY